MTRGVVIVKQTLKTIDTNAVDPLITISLSNCQHWSKSQSHRKVISMNESLEWRRLYSFFDVCKMCVRDPRHASVVNDLVVPKGSDPWMVGKPKQWSSACCWLVSPMRRPVSSCTPPLKLDAIIHAVSTLNPLHQLNFLFLSFYVFLVHEMWKVQCSLNQIIAHVDLGCSCLTRGWLRFTIPYREHDVPIGTFRGYLQKKTFSSGKLNSSMCALIQHVWERQDAKSCPYSACHREVPLKRWNKYHHSPRWSCFV